MAIYHFTSSSADCLAIELAQQLKSKSSVFTPQWIITGHHSTSDYLLDQIAHHNGIAANIKFKQAIPFIEYLHYHLGYAVDRKELLGSDQLTWYIDKILQDHAFKEQAKASQVLEYIGDNAMKRFTLSEKINQLFTSYQEEKPELIESWNKGETLTNEPDEAWQAFIWQSLKANYKYKLRDLTLIFNEVKQAIKTDEGRETIKQHYPALFFYGNLPYSKQLVDVMEELSQVIDIFVFRNDLPSSMEHSIVQNMGSVFKHHEKLWQHIPSTSLDHSKTKTPPENLLHLLQHSLLNNQADEINLPTTDDSLVIASSYSVNREVEALYHHLLKLFKGNTALAAKDVYVIIPDFENYASAISTYFDFSNQLDYEGNAIPLIPYTIYDTNHRVYASPYAALEAIIHFDADRFTSKQVLKLLDYDYIRERFDFTDTDLLVRALDKANIRHDFEGNSKTETQLVSWSYGLKRLIYGFCLAPDLEDEVLEFDHDSFFPVVDFEESERYELLKLSNFVDVLQDWLEKREHTRSLVEWIAFLEKDTIETYISTQKYDTSLFRKLIGQLHQLTENGLDGLYDFSVIRYYITSTLSTLTTGERKGYGGVRFVSPSMFLSAPAKIYAFLGLNSSDFPRKVTHVSFDLSDDDRLTKTDYDKNLFLNILLSAEEHLYLSYIGNSTKDNSEIPPSSLIDEVETYLLQLTNTHLDTLVIRHPLHSFNSRYNKNATIPLVHYDLSSNYKLEEILDKTKKEKDVPELAHKNGKKVIPLSELIKFMEDAVKHYFTKTLGIYMSDRTVDLLESEHFELDNLEKWQVKNEMLQNNLQKTSTDEDRLKRKGLLPLSNIGASAFDQLEEETHLILDNETFKELTKQDPRAVTIELEVGDYLIQADITSLYGDTFLFVTPSKDKPKYQIRALLNYYVALCNGDAKDLCYIYQDGEVKTLSKTEEDIAQIKENLAEWCVLFEKSLKELFCFECGVLDNSIQNVLDSEVHDRPAELQRLINNWIKNVYNFSITSEYFKYVAQSKVFLEADKTKTFIDMFEKMQSFISPLK